MPAAITVYIYTHTHTHTHIQYLKYRSLFLPHVTVHDRCSWLAGSYSLPGVSDTQDHHVTWLSDLESFIIHCLHPMDKRKKEGCEEDTPAS